MHVGQLTARDFRNFTELTAELSPGLNIIRGDNAQGKTNLLEAAAFCATGRSRRALNERELVRFGAAEAHLRAEIINDGGPPVVVDAHIAHDGRNSKKAVAVDHIPVKQLSELIGLLPVVSFSPEDLRLIKSGPAERRAFMDREMCQISPVYYHALRQYHTALKQRNNLLKTIQKDRSLIDTLFIWDEQLCLHGRKIIAERAAFIERIGELAAETHRRVTGGAETLTLLYKPNVSNPDDFADKLKKNLSRDTALGSTSVGAHKDDAAFLIDNSDARAFGSQGQQRTAALSVKLAEIDVMETALNKQPLLLLDDVLSELDGGRQNYLMERIGPLQTLLTCTGVEEIARERGADARVMRMSNGRITDL